MSVCVCGCLCAMRVGGQFGVGGRSGGVSMCVCMHPCINDDGECRSIAVPTRACLPLCTANDGTPIPPYSLK